MDRSHPRRAARPSRSPRWPAAGELLEEVLDQVLLRELLDDLHLLETDRDLARDGAAELDAHAPFGHEQPDQLVVRHERNRDPRASPAARELGPELREAERVPRVSRLGIAGDALELLAARIEQVDVAGARGQERSRAGDDGLQELLERARSRDRLRELGELLELGDPDPRLLVQARVLDRARDERGRCDEEVDLVVRELPRRLGVGGDDADHVARAADDGEREQRLEALLLELREVLRARVGEGVVADEGRLAALRRPPREPLATFHHDLARLSLVRGRGCTQHEALAGLVEQVREAGLNAARVRHQSDDGLQHLGQLERRGDRRDDLLKRLLARLQRHSRGSYDDWGGRVQPLPLVGHLLDWTQVEVVTGIGGFFFRARDPKALSIWYEERFGIKTVPESYEEEVWLQETGETVFAPFPHDPR